MIKPIIRRVAEPLLSRMGTALAGLLIGSLHSNPDLAVEFGAAVVAAALIALDIVVDFWSRRRGAP